MPRSKKTSPQGDLGPRQTAALEVALAAVETAESRDVLLAMWPQHYDMPPPRGISVKMLKLAIAYRLQAAAYGGLRHPARCHLQQVVRNSANVAKPPLPIALGTRLIRQWHGRTYEAVIESTGVVVNGRTYSSLTDAAYAITGAKWSGPRFFGMSKVKAK